MLDAIESAIGTSPVLEIRSGTIPTNELSSDTGLLLAEIDLPSDWLSPAFSATKNISGIWQSPAAIDTGTASYFRLKDTTQTTTHIQGSITTAGGGGDIILDKVDINLGEPVRITSFSFIETQGS
jgi:hypothetical protein